MPRLRQLAIVACGAASALLVATVLALPPAPLGGAPTPPPTHVAGAYHVHSARSDGSGTVEEIAAAAARAGLQFVIITDHGDGTRQPDPPVYRSGVLCLDAVEISTRDGHYVALDMPAAPYPLGGEARDVVADVRRLGGFGVAAHPDSSKAELRWRDSDLAIDAMEWLNGDSQWRDEPYPRLLGALLAYPMRPAATLAGLLDRPDDSLARWDTLTRHRAVVGIAGADAHAGIGWGRLDPYVRPPLVEIPGYEASFRAFSQRVILARPPTGDAASDAALVYTALRSGRTYTVVDGLASVGTVEFTAHAGAASASMGGRLHTSGPVTVEAHVAAGAASELVLVGDGIPLHRVTGSSLRVVLESPPSATRLEVHRPGAPGTPPVPWIVTNPIYLADPAPPAGPDGPDPVAVASASIPLQPDGWTTEQEDGSRPTLLREPYSSSIELRFVLGRASSPAPYVALRHALDPARPVPTHIMLRAWSNQPRRLSVQLRADGPPERRWARSVYVDQTPRVSVIDTRELRPPGGRGTAGRPHRVDSLLIVVDTVNTLPGTRATVWVDDVRIATVAVGAQVRTPSNR